MKRAFGPGVRRQRLETPSETIVPATLKELLTDPDMNLQEIISYENTFQLETGEQVTQLVCMGQYLTTALYPATTLGVFITKNPSFTAGQVIDTTVTSFARKHPKNEKVVEISAKT